MLPGNPDWRMDVAKGGELVFLLIIALIGLLFMPMAETGKGTAGLIRGALGDLEMARGDYDRNKGDFQFSVEISGRDNIDHSDISGTYAVIGPWTTAGFILDTDQGPRSLCAGSACNWFGSHVKLNRGERIATSTVHVEAPLIRIDQLQQQATTLAETGTAYLLGTAQAEGVKPSPPTLDAAGGLVSFHYASPALLERLAGRTLANAELVWQVRHPPGAELPAIDAAQPQRASIPPLLQRWLEDASSANP